MLRCDAKEFEALKKALAAACGHCRDANGLLVAPPFQLHLDAVVMAMLTGMMGDNVCSADTVHLDAWPRIFGAF